MFPTATQNIYGLTDGPQIYVWIILASLFTSLINIINSKFLLPATSYEFVFILGGIINVLFLVVSLFYQETLDEERLANKNALVPEKQRKAEIAKQEAK